MPERILMLNNHIIALNNAYALKIANIHQKEKYSYFSLTIYQELNLLCPLNLIIESQTSV